MPTALRTGAYRIYSYDCAEPRHVHTDRENRSAKFWLDPDASLETNHGYSRKDGSRAVASTACVRWVRFHMIFTKSLRDGIRYGRIRSSIRIWTRPHVKVGGRYRMDEGHIVVDSIARITVADVTNDLARESGFENVDDLLGIARHGSGDNVYLIRFHYMPPGAVGTPKWVGSS